MTKRKKRVRISGLVRTARRARKQLSVGIPPAEAERFRAWIRGSVDRTEAICRDHRMTPEDLPTPSYRAYRFLKALDLEDVPERQGPVPQAARTIRISGIIAVQNDINDRMAEWADSEPEAPTEDHPQVQALLERITAHVERIDELAQREGATPGQLPDRSRRAFQWLKFLSHPAALVNHLETLRALYDACQARSVRRQAPRALRKMRVRITFAYVSYLYKSRAADDVVAVKLNEGFIGAPPDLLQALARVLFSSAQEADEERVKTYALSDDFIEVVNALEMTTAEVDERTAGRYVDLKTVFDRVNGTYFSGKLDRPRLTWSGRITRLKMGHYDFLRDTVMLSVTLDAPDVPECVLDFVMYHELLHKKLGVKLVNGRRYAHTRDFREAESAFPHYEEAQAFLQTTAGAT